MVRSLLGNLLLVVGLVVPAAANDATGRAGWNSGATELSPATVLALARVELSASEPGIDEAELELVSTRMGLSATHYVFEQRFEGTRVVGTALIVSIAPDGRVIGHHANLARSRVAPAPGSLSTGELIRRADLTAATVLERSRAYFEVGGIARPVEHLVLDEGPHRRSHAFVDVATGDLLGLFASWASIEGQVFRANPVTTLNDPTLRDGGDAAAAVPAAAYSLVALEGLASTGHLDGPHAHIVDIDAPFTSRARVEDGLRFERDRDEFEEVNVYHHLDRSQRYLQSLGYTGARQITPDGVRADVHANRGADNSYYSSTSSGPLLLFGDGGVDDAEDPDIILHEYAHAIHDWLSPGVLFTGSESEARAVSEGFGDYWAFSSGYAESMASGRDPGCIGDWDARCDGADCGYPSAADCLRRVDLELDQTDFKVSKVPGTEHQNGRIWSRFLRDLFLANVAALGPEQGRRRTDTLVLEGLFGLPLNPDFKLVIDRMLMADAALFGGRTGPAICAAARARGFGAPGRCVAPYRGETLAIGSPEPRAVTGGSRIEQTVVVGSAEPIRRITISTELDRVVPVGVTIALRSPDGSILVLKSAAETVPQSVVWGRDRIPDDSLTALTGSSAAGPWTLIIESAPQTPALVLRSWTLLFELDRPGVDARPSSAESILIPAVGHTAGANGTFYVSDLMLVNRGDDRELTLTFTPTGTDGSRDFRIVRVPVVAGERLMLRDLVRVIFDTTGTGTLELLGGGDLVVSTRTYNLAATGTFGQSVPAIDEEGHGRRLHLPQVQENPDFRTNLGVVETAGAGAEIDLVVHDEDGAPIGSSRIALAPFEHRQIPVSSFAARSDLGAATANLTVVSESGEIAGYASVVDNRTGDSTFTPARALPAEARALTIPAVGHTAGANGTFWRSDVWLHNPSSASETAELHFFAPGEAPRLHRVEIPGGSVRVLADLVSETWSTNGVGALHLEPGELIVTSRTWNDDPAGSFGQNVPALPPHRALSSAGTHHTLPHAVQDETFRTNVGVAEVAGGPVEVRIEVRGPAGELRCSADWSVAPFQLRQSSLVELGCATLHGGRVEIEHRGGAGAVLGYASVVDQRSGDPSFFVSE